MRRCEALAVLWREPGARRRPGGALKRDFLERLPQATRAQLELWGAEPEAEAATGPQYPWGWDPPGARRRMRLKTESVTGTVAGLPRAWSWGPRLWRVLGEYLAGRGRPQAGAAGG
eukprot:gene1070-23243_t